MYGTCGVCGVLGDSSGVEASLLASAAAVSSSESACTPRERILYWQPTGPNPPNLLDDFSRPALRHGSLNPLSHIAWYLPPPPARVFSTTPQSATAHAPQPTPCLNAPKHHQACAYVKSL